MLEAVLMELEGVVVETRVLRAEALRRALAALGVTLDGDALGDDFSGLPPRERASALLWATGVGGDETDVDLVTFHAEREFASRAGAGLTLVDGAVECIRALHGHARLAVVTRATRRVAEAMLALAGVDEAFDCVVAAEDVRDPKPAPAGYALALARLSRRRPVYPAGCVALEDGHAGIRAAHAAGIRCIAVGAIPPSEAMGAQCDAWLPSLRGQTVESLETLLRSGESHAR